MVEITFTLSKKYTRMDFKKRHTKGSNSTSQFNLTQTKNKQSHQPLGKYEEIKFINPLKKYFLVYQKLSLKGQIYQKI
jgi:hypothetical protein